MSNHRPLRTLVTGMVVVAAASVSITGCNSDSSDSSGLNAAVAANNSQINAQILAAEQAAWAAGEGGSYTGTYSVSTSTAQNGGGANAALGCVTGINIADVLAANVIAAPVNATVNFTINFRRQGDNYTYVTYADNFGLTGTGTGTLTRNGDFALTVTVTPDLELTAGSINLSGKFASPQPGPGKDMGSISVNAAVNSANAIKRLIGTGLGKLSVPAVATNPLAVVLNASGDPSTSPDLAGSNLPNPVTSTFSQRSLSYVNGYATGGWSSWSTPGAFTYTSGVSAYSIPKGYTASQPNSPYSTNDVYAGIKVAKVSTTSSLIAGFTNVNSTYMTKGTDGKWYSLGSESKTYTSGGVTESYAWSVPPSAQPTTGAVGETLTVLLSVSNGMPPLAGQSSTYTYQATTLLVANSNATFPSSNFALPASAPSISSPCFQSAVKNDLTNIIWTTNASSGALTSNKTSDKPGFFSSAKSTTYMQQAGPNYNYVAEVESYNSIGAITGKTQTWQTTK